MDSTTTRKEFCKKMALSSLAALAYPGLESRSAHADDGMREQGASASEGAGQSSSTHAVSSDQNLVRNVGGWVGSPYVVYPGSTATPKVLY
jgi:hypothetical protein